MARKLILKPRGCGLKTPAEYAKHVLKVTGMALPEAATIPKELWIDGKNSITARNAVLRKIGCKGPIITKEGVRGIVSALPDEPSVAVVGREQLLAAWVTALAGPKLSIAYPKMLQELVPVMDSGQQIRGVGGVGSTDVMVGLCGESAHITSYKEAPADVLIKDDKLHTTPFTLSTRKVLMASGPVARGFNKKVFAADIAAVVCMPEDVTLNYSMIGQTTVYGNSKLVGGSTTEESFKYFSSDLRDILAALTAKDALYPGSGRWWAVDGITPILIPLATGDTAYVCNVTIHILKSRLEQPIVDSAAYMTSLAPTNPNIFMDTELTFDNVAAINGEPVVTTSSVEDIVRRMLGQIPGQAAAIPTSIFGGQNLPTRLVPFHDMMIDMSDVTETPKLTGEPLHDAYQTALSKVIEADLGEVSTRLALEHMLEVDSIVNRIDDILRYRTTAATMYSVSVDSIIDIVSGTATVQQQRQLLDAQVLVYAREGVNVCNSADREPGGATITPKQAPW